jgi:hypothetical protein
MRGRILARLRNKASIYSWPEFARRVRARPDPLLARLAEFPDCVLVAGCQRSGTTVLTQVIAGSDGFDSFQFTHDNELDAAQILAGLVPFRASGRVCFQTTYVNERFPEYWSSGDRFRLVWVLREPHGVVYSMINNWSRFALNELFMSCGLTAATEQERQDVARSGVGALTLARRACLAYVGKLRQLSDILQRVPASRLCVVDYHDLVTRPESNLRELYAYLEVPYRQDRTALLRTDSLKKSLMLDDRLRQQIDEQCVPAYEAMTAATRPRRPAEAKRMQASRPTGLPHTL